MRQELVSAIKYWDYVAPAVKYPSNESEVNELISELDELLNLIGNDEKHRLMGLVDVISSLISSYEQENYTKHSTSGVDALKFLMDEHQLKQSDLPEIGSQGVVSEILNKKRTLNLRQITLLSKRFHVDPSTFIDD